MLVSARTYYLKRAVVLRLSFVCAVFSVCCYWVLMVMRSFTHGTCARAPQRAGRPILQLITDDRVVPILKLALHHGFHHLQTHHLAQRVIGTGLRDESDGEGKLHVASRYRASRSGRGEDLQRTTVTAYMLLAVVYDQPTADC